MQNALLSGLSGLISNQRYLDVIGNNLANTNTTGFKTSRVTFYDIVSQSLKPAAGATGSRGGTNPQQIGRGTAIGSIDRNMVQGSLLTTGRNLDLAIQGEGFFVLNNGNRDFYTRVGTFGLDADENLVDLRTGMKVQSADGSDIVINLNTVIPPEATSLIEFSGNLPAVITGPLSEELRTDTPFEEHLSAVIQGNAGPYAGIAGGETLSIQIDGGLLQSFTLPVPAAPGTGLTVNELVTFLNGPGGLTGATAVDNGGMVEIRSDSAGNGSTVFIDPASTGATAIFPAGAIGTGASGSEAVATGATDINDLQDNIQDYSVGDQILLGGTRPDGTVVSAAFVYGPQPAQNGTTLGELVSFIDNLFQAPSGGATATLFTDGSIQLLANETGEAFMTLAINDPPGALNTGLGATSWNQNFFRTTVDGTPPDTETLVTPVFDSVGRQQPVSLEFERQADGTWNMTASLDPLLGTVVSPPLTGISFDETGNLNIVPSTQLIIDWTALPGTQAIDLDFGNTGDQPGITQYGIPSSTVALADGYEAGNLSNIGVRGDGVIEGFFTNGQIQDIGQLGLVLFTNTGGLESVGESLWTNTSNSGNATLTSAQQGSAGSIVAGSLEGSNVQISEQFIQLIEAQRAFQANARIISTTDEVLAELVNLI